MARHWHHRVSLVDGALSDTPPRMCVHVGDNTQLVFPAMLPQRRVASCVKNNGASLISVRIEIVVADERRDSIGSVVLRSQQKGAAFAFSLSTQPQLNDYP